MTTESIRTRRDRFAQAALTGLLAHIDRNAPAAVREAQLNAISAEAVEYADATIARLNRTAIYPAEINPNDEAAIDNARRG
ncbi:hypothetical protein [Deinococcus enclensis]|uniref:Uncharacterized protein n=1 Tax=Deinococcus enclensis TaxID=1049582 RepID=A0ABT9MEC8_9DEIO|nr:hypothetical protein [Deinococcus enclensis]MDP9764905.1 hypothetical protein [Deinococcus enclensis]